MRRNLEDGCTLWTIGRWGRDSLEAARLPVREEQIWSMEMESLAWMKKVLCEQGSLERIPVGLNLRVGAGGSKPKNFPSLTNGTLSKNSNSYRDKSWGQVGRGGQKSEMFVLGRAWIREPSATAEQGRTFTYNLHWPEWSSCPKYPETQVKPHEEGSFLLCHSSSWEHLSPSESFNMAEQIWSVGSAVWFLTIEETIFQGIPNFWLTANQWTLIFSLENVLVLWMWRMAEHHNPCDGPTGSQEVTI